jgi:hypothetical protein
LVSFTPTVSVIATKEQTVTLDSQLILICILGVRNLSATTPRKPDPRDNPNAEPRFLEQVELFFNRAASKTGISKDYLEMIRTCDNVIRFSIPIRRDNGSIENIICYRA